MWRKKSDSRSGDSPFPGTPQILDAHAAVLAVERVAADAIVMQSSPEFVDVLGPMARLAPGPAGTESGLPTLREVEDPPSLIALASGYALMGLRTSAWASHLGGALEALSSAAGKRLGFVVHLSARAAARHAPSLQGGHDDYHRVASAGLFQLFARNAQEAADFAVIAHRIAELSLTPGICAHDLYETGHAVRGVRLPEPALIGRYLGLSGDTISSPTPAQEVLFGSQRRRIPRLLDPDHPAGIGSSQDRGTFLDALAAQRPFFADAIVSITESAMNEFAALTGRRYERIATYRCDDADVLVVAQGAILEALEPVIDQLRAAEKIRAGAVGVTMYRPFPGAELTHMLRGKRAVTVLERTEEALSGESPLCREVRAALDKAVENGASSVGSPLHPGYATFRRVGERPQISSAVYGVGGGIPAFADLAAVYRNMSAGGRQRRRVYVGVGFDRLTRRFPHLETLQQKLRRTYPELPQLSLSGDPESIVSEAAGRAVELHFASAQGGLFAANLFAQAIGETFAWDVRTFPEGGLEPSLETTRVTMTYARDDEHLRGKPTACDTILVSGERILDDVVARTRLKPGAALIVESDRRPEELWTRMSARCARRIREAHLALYGMNGRRIASETASKPAFVDQLEVWALLGAHLRIGAGVSADGIDRFTTTLREHLDRLFGANATPVDDIVTALRRGAEESSAIDYSAMPDPKPAPEVPAPWTVESGALSDETVFDPTRFWRSVGYLHASGQADQAMIDPYVATGIVPAGSSAFRDMTPYRLRVPRWVPENCTACGMCWAQCPDSALPATVQPVSSILATGMSACSGASSFIQMPRVLDPLAKQAQRLITDGGPGSYTTAGPLLRDAFARVAEKMGLPPDKLDALTREFDQVCRVVEHFPVSRTERFFDEANKTKKGSGTLLSITLNPLHCTGCGVCVAVCPDDALEWTEQTPEYLDASQRAWTLAMQLPRVTEADIATHVSASDADSHVNILLDRDVYHAMVGGDGAPPGSGVKVAVHLVTAAVESMMQPRYARHVDRLSELIGKLEDKIQGRVAGVVRINDFDDFGHRLSRIEGKALSSGSLASMFQGDGALRSVDPAELKRLTEILADLKAQRERYRKGAGGSGRARMVLAIDPGSAPFWTAAYPYNPHPHPWVSLLPGEEISMAEGIYAGLAGIVAREAAACRIAELLLEDAYTPATHDAVFRSFGANDLTREESDLVPRLLVVGHAGSTHGDRINAMLATGLPIMVVLINTEAVSPEDPARAGGKAPQRPPVPGGIDVLSLGGGRAFVLQTTAGTPGHLIAGVTQSLAAPRSSLFHIYASDPQRHGIAPEQSAAQARMAAESRVFPLLRFDPDQPPTSRLTVEGNPAPESDWGRLEMNVKEPSGRDASFTVALTCADWAVREARYLHHFETKPKGYPSDHTKPLAEYIDLPADARDHVEAYIHVIDDRQRHFVAIVSNDMAAVTAASRDAWRRLRELAAAPSAAARPDRPAAEPEAPAVPEPVAAASAGRADAMQQITERLLWLCGYGQDPAFFKQSLGEFVKRKPETAPLQED